MELGPDVVAKLWTMGMAKVPLEVCGVVVGDADGYYDAFECWNYAPTPHEEFWMNPHELARYRALYLQVALWHSHPTGRWLLSALDKRLMILIGLPMILVAPKPFPAVMFYQQMPDRQILEVARYDLRAMEAALS